MDIKESVVIRQKATETIDFASALANRDAYEKPFDGEGLFARDVDGRLLRVTESTTADFDTDVHLTIDGTAVVVKKAMPLRDSQGSILRDADGNAIPRPTTIYDATTAAFVKQVGDKHPIPTLCHKEHLPPVGVCRICTVEAAEQTRRGLRRKLVPSCVQHVSEGMIVNTLSSEADPEAAERVKLACSVVTELLVADHLETVHAHPNAAERGNELAELANRLKIRSSRFAKAKLDQIVDLSATQNPQYKSDVESPRRRRRELDVSSQMVVVDPSQCIMCGRCSRGCNYIKENHVIGRFGKGYASHIGFDLDDPMGKSSCVSCGECVISCPTGALEFQPSYIQSLQSANEASSEASSVSDLLRIPLFSGLPYKFVQINQASFKRRRLKAGETLCKEGEYGSTAFVLVKGRFDVCLQTPRGAVRNERGRGPLSWLFGFHTVAKRLGGMARLSDFRGIRLAEDTHLEVSPQDVIIGEMTCLNRYPRSATVTAKEDAEVVEIRRNVLYMLQRNATSREILDRVYRTRSLRNQLTSLPIFEGLTDSIRERAADFLKDKVDLITVDPGQLIFRQDEPADAVYINRLGFVKVTQKYGVSERVLSYISPGGYFGEIGVLTEVLRELGEKQVEPGIRTATCSALDHVELIRIRARDFRLLLRTIPELVEPLAKTAKTVLERDNEFRKKLSEISTDEFLDQGLFLAQSLLVLDLEKCTRCDECTKACADTHGGVTRLIREGLRFDKFLVASSCRSCMDPYCLVGCPVDAIHRDGNSLEINIEDYCIGCGLCAQNCPYGNINMHGLPKYEKDAKTGRQKKVYEVRDGRKIPVIQQHATTCDLCRSIDGKPSCVYACPHDAAHRMSGQELLKIIEHEGKAVLG